MHWFIFAFQISNGKYHLSYIKKINNHFNNIHSSHHVQGTCENHSVALQNCRSKKNRSSKDIYKQSKAKLSSEVDNNTKMGVEKQVVRPGTGPKPTAGQNVTVHCTGFGQLALFLDKTLFLFTYFDLQVRKSIAFCLVTDKIYQSIETWDLSFTIL